jgi:restriction system protein
MSLKSIFKGWIGELKTTAAESLLLDSNTYQVYNNVLIPTYQATTQIDHIIVSRYGIFVLETKDKTGWIFGNEDNKEWTQVIYHKKYHFQNPLRQNYLHTKSLSEYLGVDHNKIFPLIVFWGDCKFKTTMPPNVVKGVFAPTDYIKRKTQVILSEKEVTDICEKIRNAQGSSGFGNQINHVRNLKNRFTDGTCPKCGGKLLNRVVSKGTNAGTEFLGCVNFPQCKYTKDIK